MASKRMGGTPWPHGRLDADWMEKCQLEPGSTLWSADVGVSVWKYSVIFCTTQSWMDGWHEGSGATRGAQGMTRLTYAPVVKSIPWERIGTAADPADVEKIVVMLMVSGQVYGQGSSCTAVCLTNDTTRPMQHRAIHRFGTQVPLRWVVDAYICTSTATGTC